MRASLICLILGPLLAVLLLSGVLVYVVARASLVGQFDEHLLARARIFASLVVEEWPDADDPAAPVALALEYDGALDEESLGILLSVAAADGSTVARSPGWPDEIAAKMGARAHDDSWVRSVEIEPGRPGRLAGVAVRARRDEDAPSPGNAPAPMVVVETIGPSHALDTTLASLAAALIAGGVLAASGTLLAVAIGVSRGLGPVRRLADELDRTEADTTPALSPAAAYPAELRPILAALHGLLRRVSEAVQRERRITDAIAHEFRTPIAELRSLTDIAERWPQPERLQKTVTEASAIADEMESLMSSLLAAARGGAPFDSSSVEPIALLPLARDILASFPDDGQPRAAFASEGDEAACWIGPRGAVTAIVRNLIDNAREYTPKSGEVRLEVRPITGGATMSVENGPVSLRSDQLEQMFEPFWRADPSRTDRGHRGLGLAIVASLCKTLGLHWEAKLIASARLRVTISTMPPHAP